MLLLGLIHPGLMYPCSMWWLCLPAQGCTGVQCIPVKAVLLRPDGTQQLHEHSNCSQCDSCGRCGCSCRALNTPRVDLGSCTLPCTNVILGAAAVCMQALHPNWQQRDCLHSNAWNTCNPVQVMQVNMAVIWGMDACALCEPGLIQQWLNFYIVSLFTNTYVCPVLLNSIIQYYTTAHVKEHLIWKSVHADFPVKWLYLFIFLM